jgi:competence protein ComEC
VAPGRVVIVATLAGLAVGVVSTGLAPGAAWAAALAAGSLVVVTADPIARRVLVVLAVTAAAAAHGARARDRVVHAPLVAWFDAIVGPEERGPVIVVGRLAGDAALVDGRARLLIDVRAVEAGGRRWRLGGRVQTYVGGDLVAGAVDHWTRGREIHAPVLLSRPPIALNPGGPGERWQTLRRPFDLTGTVKSALVVRVWSASWWDEAAARVRAAVRRGAIRLFPAPSDQSGAILVAILIGDRAGLDVDLERRLQTAGTYHVIAISGGNVALLTAWVFLAARLVVRSARRVSAMTIAVVVAYGWMVGGEPSVTRAVTAAAIYLSCGLLGLAPAAIDVLGVVALLVALYDPLTVVEPGAWLSFGATLGIVVFTSRLMGWLASNRAGAVSGRRAVTWFAALFGATLAAEVALLPVSAALFSRVGVAGLVLNVVAVPMIAVVQVAGAAALVLVHAWPQAAAAAAAATTLAVAAIVESARLVEVAPWLSWRVPPPSVAVIVAYYAGLVAGLRWWRHARRRHAAAVVFVASGLVITIAPAVEWRQPPAGWLRVTLADVGQGDAILVQFPDGRSLLLDAGGTLGRFDVGDRILAPVLWASGVRRLDWLAFTHADVDHIGGADAVLRVFQPREIWEGVPVPSDVRRRALRLAAAGRGTPWRTLQRGDRIDAGAATVEVVSPPLPDWERPRVRNEDSLVLRVRFKRVEFLFTGDIGADTERTLATDDDEGAVPVRVLKVAHHGSRSSTSEAFASRYVPHVALISAGRGNAFGHPAAEVLGRLERAGARVFRTDADGAVVVETDGFVTSVRSMTGRRWTVRVREPGA